MFLYFHTDKPPVNLPSNPECSLFIARLSPITTEESLKEYFGQYGTIQSLRLVCDIVTGYSKGYAFIEFYNQHDAKEAYKRSHRHILDGQEIVVEYELERTMIGWVPRRMGGGFGGKKESGQLRFGGRDRPFRTI
eukprot:Ihof_evm4s93 gene=Ihof_evmTU4s93